MRRLWSIPGLFLCFLPVLAHAAEKPVRDPAALEALNQLGKNLRNLKQFEVSVDSTTDRVLESGQPLQFYHHTQMLVGRPDRLRIQTTSVEPGGSKTLYYDGKQATLYSKQANTYVTAEAPGTIEKLADTLKARYGIELPLADLFYWGEDGAKNDALTSAIYVGDELQPNGMVCKHYAYRQPGIDWQLWIERDNAMLPCRLSIATQTDSARPQHTAVYSWKLSPDVAESNFAFTPPDGAVKSDFKRADAVAAPKKK